MENSEDRVRLLTEEVKAMRSEIQALREALNKFLSTPPVVYNISNVQGEHSSNVQLVNSLYNRGDNNSNQLERI